MHQKTFNPSLMPSHRHATYGFTLIELSIVLIVIGLLIGGVTVGLNIRDSAKLTSILADAEKHRSNMKNFKDQYNYYPGDFPNATSLWPAMTGTEACDDTGDASNNRTSTTLIAATCNGRGNGFIGNRFVDATQFSNTSNIDLREQRERFYAWQHLALAGFINGSFSGHSISGNGALSPGVNIPQTNFSNALGFSIEYSTVNNTSIDSSRAWPVQGRIHHLFSWSRPNAAINDENLITSPDARRLDKKIDDGLPYSGNVFAFGQTSGDFDDCTLSTNKYNTADPDQICGQYMRNFLE